jgi:CBS domain-containing protein
VDAGHVLRGIVSTTDLLRVARIEMQSPRSLARVWPPPHRVGDMMRTTVVTIDQDAPLSAAASEMVEHRIHRLVVTRAGAPVGVLSTRDIARAIVAARVPEPLSSVMTPSPITIDLGDSIDVAVGRLTDEHVHGLVVVDGEWPVGVFTQQEAIKARALPAALRALPVEQIMSLETICYDQETPLYRVAAALVGSRVRRILAVERRKLVGIASGFDLARLMVPAYSPAALAG